MPTNPRLHLKSRLDFSFILVLILFGILWLAGGASQADVAGQVIARGGAWAILAAAILFCRTPSFQSVRAVTLFLSMAVLLVLLQLVPLPPALWQSLPGRTLFAEAAAASGQEQPWRPWSLVPGATANAAGSLVIPVAVLVLLAGLSARARAKLPALVLILAIASMIAGLLQFSGGRLGNPFVNDTPGQVSGMFANRNHFALLLAIGCVVAPVWALQDEAKWRRKGAVALGLLLLFALTILASGSRAGMAVGCLAIGIGLLIARKGIRHELRHAPRWTFPALILSVVGTIIAFVLISVMAGRAESITRVIALDVNDDMRSRSLPTVLAMLQGYFPSGTGFGSFPQIFRVHEPFDILQYKYLNHAHNDFIEIAIDGGLPAAALLIAALGYWLIRSIRAWRPGSELTLPRLGSAILLLVMISSLFDYPARTPIIMAIIVIAAFWLEGKSVRQEK
ncbi:O-Antigen ligase [Sphingomonas laterariae]|uniref:O-Antigen ligase n=1 Tax=Edaphosphingomonas laterariae TaxID=861865 RepID=A0A239JWZ8_9SPHN|nr:O-antigen ligase family protein [Sphingomonas laterariae]SNT10280.1 O-Antigen ligase [Sphingomonas laterariae]